jgi:hypothetical protein
MSESRGPNRTDESKRRMERRLDRREAQFERMSEQAADRERTIARLRADLRRYQRQPLIRFARVVRDRFRAIVAPLPSSRGGAVAAEAAEGTAPHRPVASTVALPSDRPPSIAIHLSAPNAQAGATWGDTPFAEALRSGFQARGWVATVHAQDAWDAPASRDADVVLHLFGVRVPPVRPGQVSLLWIISHPDQVTARRCGTYDAVFVASSTFADELAGRIKSRVFTLAQATDPDRFYPDPTGPDHELLFVGGWRPDGRPILDALAGTTFDLAVYGGKWTPERLDPRYLRGEWIPNDQLRRYYSSADIVLNDTWHDMRDEGFIPNRVYDALASGAFVLSDLVAGMDEAFDGGVQTYDTDDELATIIEDALANPEARRAMAERGRAAVLARHTFAHRVEAIIATLHGLPAAEGIARRSRR